MGHGVPLDRQMYPPLVGWRSEATVVVTGEVSANSAKG
jgi:hypothetical protein